MLPLSTVVAPLTFLGALSSVLSLKFSVWLMLFLIRAKMGVEGPVKVLTCQDYIREDYFMESIRQE